MSDRLIVATTIGSLLALIIGVYAACWPRKPRRARVHGQRRRGYIR